MTQKALWVIDLVTNLLVLANAGAMRAVASSTSISFREGKEQAAAVRQMYRAAGIQLNPSCHQRRGAIVRMDSGIGADEWANLQDPRLRRAPSRSTWMLVANNSSIGSFPRPSKFCRPTPYEFSLVFSCDAAIAR
jgi:hypothetical protein